MPDYIVNTPVLLLVFNRVDTTKKVFEAIRAMRPKKLFVAADGARSGKAGEEELCKEVRAIVSSIDWDCELHTLFRDENLGCGRAVSSAINWFFKQVEEGIILEDDTLPNESFFRFCEAMLSRYRDDTRMAQVNGSNFQLGKKWGKASYYFSNYPMIWGWATWRRAWMNYEFDLSSYPHIKDQSFFKNLFHTKREHNYWNGIFEKMYAGFQQDKPPIDTWDYQWIYSCWKNQKLSITPNTNLITNIGFGKAATHTQKESLVASLPLRSLEKDLTHPADIVVYKSADKKLFRNYFFPKERLNELRNTLYRYFPVGIMRILRSARRKFFPGLN